MGKKLPKQKDLKKVLWFFIKLNLFLLPFYIVIYFDLKYEPAQIAFAKLVAFFFNFLGFKIIQDGFILYLGNNNFPIDISFDCIGWKSSYSLIALVAALPGDLKQKMIFLLKWVPMMFLFNFLRVLSAIIVGFLFGFNYMILFHDYFLQPLMIFLVLFIWMIYINSTEKEKIYRSKK
ncbi:MAG: archaeosortase/exosortase family protein [Candidatus Aenigmatarchaeota archaeon]